ncbi:MAG: hypothetical protein AAB613_00805 [Patescibacteria group bacterium]
MPNRTVSIALTNPALSALYQTVGGVKSVEFGKMVSGTLSVTSILTNVKENESLGFPERI